MTDFSSIIDEFEAYLFSSGLYSKGTSRYYARNYVKPAIEKILVPWFNKNGLENPFERYDTNNINIGQRSLIAAISDCIISQEAKNPQLGLTKKTVSNWRSGLRAFFTFLETQNYCFDYKSSNKVLNHNIQQSGVSVVFSNLNLFKTFKARLITQDRAYNHMIYPARLINLIFNNSNLKSNYHGLLADAINDTIFLIDGTGSYKQLLRDISTLVIDYNLKNGNSIIIGKTDSWFVFTENPSTNGYEKIMAKGLADLSLDHNTPLQNILDTSKAQQDYPTLKKLSDLYASYVKGSSVSGNYLKVSNIRSFKDYSSGCYAEIKNNPAFNSDFIKKLLKDLKNLYNNIGFTIMLRNYNSSKGKGTPVKSNSKNSTISKI